MWFNWKVWETADEVYMIIWKQTNDRNEPKKYTE